MSAGRKKGPYIDICILKCISLRVSRTAGRCLVHEKTRKNKFEVERDASDQEGRQYHRGARGESRGQSPELERAKQIRKNFDARRDAVRAWALGQGYKDWDGDAKNYQKWRDGVTAKFARQTKGLGEQGLDVGPYQDFF